MRHMILAFAALAMIAPATAQAQEKRGDGIVYVAGDDRAMANAIAEGRRTLPDFFIHFAKPSPGESGFMVKYDLLPEPDKFEYIWATLLSHSSGVTVARLANSPIDPRFEYGETVTITDAEIVDWGYYRDGVMQGNFTTRALMPHMPAKDVEAINTAFGW